MGEKLREMGIRMIDTIRNHQSALARRRGKWGRAENLERKGIEEALQKREKEIKRLVDENAIIVEIGRIVSLTPNIEEIYERFAEEVRKLIPFDRIGITLIESSTNLATYDYTKGVEAEHCRMRERIPLSDPLIQKIMHTKTGVIIQGEDIDKVVAQNPILQSTVQAGLQSMILVPLISKGQVFGFLHLRSTQPNVYTDADLTLVEGISNQIACAITNAQLCAEQKRVEEKIVFQASLLDQVRNAVIATGLDGKIIFWNKFAERLYQWSSEEAIGKKINEVIPSQIVLDDKPLNYGEGEFIGRRRDGSTFPTFLTNSVIRDTEGKVAGIIIVAVDITERKRQEELLQQSEEKYRSLFEESKDVIFITTPEGRVLDINPAGMELFGYSSKEEFLKVNISRDIYVHSEDRERYERALAEKGFVKDFGLTLKKRSGEKLSILETATAVRDGKGAIVAYRGILRDVTEQKNLEQQFLQAQKMEAIGLLAGGIAHDFNNLLMLIFGNVELGLIKVERSNPLYDIFTKIQETAKKASVLTHKLLAFSRRQVLQPKVLDVAKLIINLSKISNRIIGEDIELKMEFEPNLGHVYVDQGSLEQVLMNLTVNARDAMPQGGVLTIQAQNIHLDEEFCNLHPYVKSGSYVKISFQDTGVGMDEKTLQHIFEPFFTTKDQGTGLGLAVVYGIVKQHKGYVMASSHLREGARFDLYFPLQQDTLIQEAVDVVIKSVPRGTETLLLAEDESELRELLETFLRELGYKVILASDGEEALKVFSAHHHTIDLVILDAVMPKISGPKAYDQMGSLCPNMPCLFLTGYSEEIVRKHFDQNVEIQILRKPIALKEIGRKVREILDQAGKRKG